MKREKTPALLAVVIKASTGQWFVAAIYLDGSAEPLVRSEPGNLDSYVGQCDDEQLSFLRHRLSGAMQRGCDRLWARDAKAARIVLIADDDLPDSGDDLLSRLAEHFHTWMTSPPVSFYRGHGEATIEDLQSLDCLVGSPGNTERDCLQRALPQLCRQLADANGWEVIPKPDS